MIIPVYYTYFLQVKRGDSIPNPATWSIWVAVMLLNGATYSKMTENLLESFVAIVAPVSLLFMFLYIIRHRKFGKLGKTEIIVLILTFLIGILWKFTNATISNLCLQAILLFSFWPTAKGLIKNELKEKPLPWFIAVGAYLFLIAANAFNLNDDYAKLVFPLLNGVIGNGSIGIIAIIKTREC